MGSNLENDEGHEAEDFALEDRSQFSAPRLVEGVRDLLITWFKQAHNRKPWPNMSEAEQRSWISTIEERAEKLVNDVVEVVNHGDFPVVNALIDSFTVKKGEVKVVAKGFADNDMLAILNDAGEKRVQITVMRNDQFDEHRDTLHPDPDQPGLPGVKMPKPGFEDDDDDHTPEPQVDEPPVENPEGEQEAGAEALKPKSDQWRGGFNSRMARHKREENPFNPNSGPDWEEWKADWFAGWDAADFDDKAPSLEEKPIGEVSEGSDSMITGDGEVEEPPVEEAPPAKAGKKKPAKPAPVVEPDLEPEGDAAITDHEGGPIETAEQAHAYGRACRKDGKGTGANPFQVGSDFGKAWLRGYNEQRKEDYAKEF